MSDEFQAMYVRLPKELHAAVKKQADAEDRTMAQMIRVALRHYLAFQDVGYKQAREVISTSEHIRKDCIVGAR